MAYSDGEIIKAILATPKGVNSYEEVMAKFPGLTEDQFVRCVEALCDRPEDYEGQGAERSAAH